jgi:ClpP class serine protease
MNANTAWHIQQASAVGMMPMIAKFLAGDMQVEDEMEIGVGISIEGEKLLNRYVSLSAEAYVSERETWYYDNFPVKMGEILMIPIIGAIAQEDYCGTAGTNTVTGWYNKAAQDKEIKAIIEVKNTPGGEVFGTRALAEAKLNVGKPIIGLTQGLECSAGLYIGATDNYKFAVSNDCLIGSCGVMTTFQDWSKWYEKNGIVVTDLYSKDSPLKNDAYRKAVKGDYKGYTDGILFKLDQSFMSFMSEHRPGISPEALQGAEFMSQDAITAGLIDAVGTFQDAYNFAQESIQNPSILTKSTINMAKKTVKMSALMAGVAQFFGAELVDDDGNAIGNIEESEESEEETEESEEKTEDETTEEETPTPGASAANIVAEKDAENLALKAQIAALKKQALKGKATNLKQEQTDKTAMTANSWMDDLTHHTDEA